MQQRYQYVVVRYVPDVVRDEAVNVGIIVRAVDGTEFKAQFLPRSATVRKLLPDADTKLVAHFERQMNELTKPSLLREGASPLGTLGRPTDAAFFSKARDAFNGTLQLTEPRGSLAADIDEALRRAFRTYVAEPTAGSRPINYQNMAPHEVRVRLWNAFESRHLVGKGRVEERIVLPGRHAPWTFDLVYRNGAINVINSIALNHAARDTNLGRALVYKGMVEDVRDGQDGPVTGVAVVQLPRDPSKVAGVGEARQMLADANIRVFPFAKLPALVAEVQRNLRHD